MNNLSNGTSQRPFRILDLPPELLHSVYEHLPIQTLLNVRLTNRHLYENSFHTFGTRVLNEVVAMLHPESINILYEISQNERLSKYVRKVTISGERVAHIFHARHALLQKSHEQGLKSGWYRQILALTFRSFKNLDVVALDHSSFHLDESYSRRACRCGARAMLQYESDNSYGMFGAEDGRHFLDALDNRDSPLYEVAFGALEMSGVLRGRAKVQLQIEEDAVFDLASKAWREELAGGVANLELFSVAGSEWFGELLGGCQNLRGLYLQGSNPARSVSFPVSRGLSTPPMWPKLKSIELFDLMLDYESLLALLRAHGEQLTSLDIQKCGLTSGTWLEPLEAIQDMPRLERLRLNHLFQHSAVFPDPADLQGSAPYIPRRVELVTQNRIQTFLDALLAAPRAFVDGSNTVDLKYEVMDLQRAIVGVE
ncbi:hypothetical protein BU24DRAFT_266118 [Aaosphaeria arxii CBS 175.79]|uniref:F-box domain-containing protein n=1 Tax=Aaosphaeria arxii CBS 175.79 TaxID=1450172 RepID=A0A6A5XFQ2_9PLEO|nr:uncharacterized protein BU24DRAFT_266118 [Aaosphaeria arxii CBS 175.79]KAF2011912.1 hypothetical protein BU24DRAFT_266118 [Aaosphaeria arxii CBS 175.79]